MATEAGITVEDVTVVRGGHTALTDITFSIGGGTLMGVLGPNGAGKSSLFGAIAGTLPIAKGTVTLHGGHRAAVDLRMSHSATALTGYFQQLLSTW